MRDSPVSFCVSEVQAFCTKQAAPSKDPFVGHCRFWDCLMFAWRIFQNHGQGFWSSFSVIMNKRIRIVWAHLGGTNFAGYASSAHAESLFGAYSNESVDRSCPVKGVFCRVRCYIFFGGKVIFKLGPKFRNQS